MGKVICKVEWLHKFQSLIYPHPPGHFKATNMPPIYSMMPQNGTIKLDKDAKRITMVKDNMAISI